MSTSQRGGRIAVIGGGAVGGLIAAFAAEAGHDVTLCLRTPVDDFTLRTEDGELLRPALKFAVEPDEVRPLDWVFLTTKAQDTEGAVPWLRALSGPGTVVAVVQNGVDQEERVAPLLPDGAAALPTLAYMAVERVAPGRIVHHYNSQLRVPEGESATRLGELLADSRLSVRAVPDFRTAAWHKLFTNVAANPLTALLQQRMHIFDDEEIRDRAWEILQEALTVARAEGARLDEDDIREGLRANLAVGPDGGTSTFYDRLAGRPLEHEHLTGAVVRGADRHGIAAPLNRLLLTMQRAVDRELRGARGSDGPAGGGSQPSVMRLGESGEPGRQPRGPAPASRPPPPGRPPGPPARPRRRSISRRSRLVGRPAPRSRTPAGATASRGGGGGLWSV